MFNFKHQLSALLFFVVVAAAAAATAKHHRERRKILYFMIFRALFLLACWLAWLAVAIERQMKILPRILSSLFIGE
jgi:hypothetical membrane protein